MRRVLIQFRYGKYYDDLSVCVCVCNFRSRLMLSSISDVLVRICANDKSIQKNVIFDSIE